MEGYQFKYVGVAHSQAGGDLVAITLERKEGGQFVAVLSVADAKRLLRDLPEQVRIADEENYGPTPQVGGPHA